MLRIHVWRCFACALLTLAGAAQPAPVPGPRGDFGGDLALLRSFYVPPPGRGHGNHVIDMWAGKPVVPLLLKAGMTNNQALIVNSHARGIRTGHGRRHAYYPHQDLAPAGTAYFSAADLANTLGRKAVLRIHNIVLAGCNREATFDAAELRRLFPNATNIIHMAAGQAGYQPMFLQLFVAESSHIRPLWEVGRGTGAAMRFDIVNQPARSATRLEPYLAELFLPGARQPFRTQVAGRELLAPAAPFVRVAARNAP